MSRDVIYAYALLSNMMRYSYDMLNELWILKFILSTSKASVKYALIFLTSNTHAIIASVIIGKA